MNQSIVSSERLNRFYSLAKEQYKNIQILKGVNAEFDKKQIIGIVGESGAGRRVRC